MPSADYRFHHLLHLRINYSDGPLLGGLLNRYAAYRSVPGGDPDLVVNLGPFPEEDRGAYLVDERYRIRPGTIACEHRYKIARWKVRISGLEERRTVVSIDANLPALGVIPGETLPALIRLKLAQKGAVLVHGAGVEKGGRAAVFSGRSGAGKTITATRLLDEGWKHLGDDSCIVHEGKVYSFLQPFSVRFTYDAEALFGFPFTRKEKAVIAGKRTLALATAGRIKLLTSLPPERVLEAPPGISGACDRFLLLLNGPDFHVEAGLPAIAAAAQAMANVRFESRELDGYLQAYAHVFPESPLLGFWEAQRRQLADSLQGARCLRITVPSRYTDDTFAGILRAVEEV